jgi:hypothetical protein
METPNERDTKEAQWMDRGRAGLEVIKRIGMTDVVADDTPALIWKAHDCILMLVRDGRILIVDDDGETEAIPADYVSLLYPLFLQVAAVEILDAGNALRAKQGGVPKPTPPHFVPPPRYGDLPFQFYIAPNCEGDLLTHPPRIKRDDEGLQRLETKGHDGWHEGDVVETAVRVEEFGLVLVTTDDATYLMTAHDFDTPIE